MPSLTKPAPPKPISQRRAVQLVGERANANADRLKADRKARNHAKRIAQIDEELIRFVDANKSGKARTVELPKFRLSIIQVDGYFSAKAELIKRIGEKMFEQLKAAVPKKDKLEIDTK